MSARIAIIGDYDSRYVSHPETNAAIEAAGRRATVDIAYDWVGTETLLSDGIGVLSGFDGFWISAGSPYRSFDGALAGIRFARESGKPLVGT